MARTNFTKVEDILSQGLEDLTVNELLILADKAAAMGDSEQARAAQERIAKARRDKDRKHWVASIKRDLAILHKRDKGILKSLNVNRKELLEMLEKTDEIDEKGWEFIHSLHDKLGLFKVEHAKDTALSNEDIVEAERLKHINKRFNVKDKWLPLR